MLTIMAQSLRLRKVHVVRSRMKAARIISPGRYEVFEEAVPPVARGRVRVRLLKAALCGSDLPYFSNSYNPSGYPFPSGYPGHECMGVVDVSECDEFKPGERVMYYPPALDAYKEYHVADPVRLQKLPGDGDMNVLLMTQLLGAVSHCAFRIDRPSGKNVVIMGQGSVGLLFTALMRNFGAETIIAADPLDYRLDAAKKMGADYVVNPSREDVEKTVSDITGGRMADIVIEAYGQQSAVINRCFDCACHNGQVAFFGICLEEAPPMNFNVFFRKELRMVASVGPDLAIDYPYALRMILTKSIDVSPLLTHVLPFEEIQTAFEMAVNRRDNAIKIILDF